MSAIEPVNATPDGVPPPAPAGIRFGVLLAVRRRAAGLTQDELAERSGLSVRALRELEHGRVRAPRRESVKALVAALALDGEEAAALLAAARPARGPRSLPWGSGVGPGVGPEPAPGDPAPVPESGLCALPSGVADFTGRAEELRRLRALAGRVAAAPSAMTVVAIAGAGGIGKTALALHLGHQLAADFPDACLYVDLRGMDGRPADPGQVLGWFLSALGLPEELIPATVEERAARFRSLLFGRRALVVLDNAADEAQVRSLLPGGPSCLVLVTGRNVLAGLETPHRLLLDVLAPADAVGLLTAIVGPRVAAVPGAAAEVARLCGYLPLALRIAGNRLASRPGWSLAYLADRLRDERARLQLLRAGDLQVAPALALSADQLSPAARTVFRRLSLVPGPDFGAGIAAVLAGTGRLAADTVLEELADASLIMPAETPGRYRLHDLVRLFAAERLADEEDEPARRAVEERMLHWLLDTAIRAGETFFPRREERTREPAAPVAAAPTARAWLEAEWTNWLAAFGRAVAAGRDDTIGAVATGLQWYFHACGGLRGDWRELYTRAVEAARRSGDGRAEARHLNRLGFGHARYAQRLDAALECLSLALAAAGTAGDRREEGWALTGLAWVHAAAGRHAEALDCGERATALMRAEDYLVGEALALETVGIALGRAQRFGDAMAYHRRALAAARAIGYGPWEGAALQSLGGTLAVLGRLPEAVDCLRQAVAIHAAEGHSWWEGLARRHLGAALYAQGRFAEAADHQSRAVAVFRASGSLYHKAKALRALGSTAARLGDVERARACWQEALQICVQLDLPQAEQVRRALARLAAAPDR